VEYPIAVLVAAVVEVWSNDFADTVWPKVRARLEYPDMHGLGWARLRCPECGHALWLHEVSWRHRGCPKAPRYAQAITHFKSPDEKMQRRDARGRVTTRKLPQELMRPEVLPSPALADDAALRYVARVLHLTASLVQERTFTEAELRRVVAAVQRDVEALAREVAFLLARHRAMKSARDRVAAEGLECGYCGRVGVLEATCPDCDQVFGAPDCEPRIAYRGGDSTVLPALLVGTSRPPLPLGVPGLLSRTPALPEARRT